MASAQPAIPLPLAWTDHTKSGLLAAIALAHDAITRVRGWCADSRIARVRLAAKAEYPHHVWHLDHTIIPTAPGFWVPWLPWSALLSWPFCWWLTLVVDHFSRKLVRFEVFSKQPSEKDICRLLDRAVGATGRAPKYTVTDQGGQFRDGFRDWCRHHGTKPRFGAIGQHGSIAIVERWILGLKSECCARILVPFGIDAMRAEIAKYGRWHAEVRPHQGPIGASASATGGRS